MVVIPIKVRFSIIGLIFLLGILSIGSTFAYFYTETNLRNFFSVEPYNTIAYENFKSPDKWLPSNVTKKEVFAKNLSNHEVIARISYTESWTSANGEILPNVVTYQDGKWLDLNDKDYSNMISDNSPHNNGDTFEFAIKHFSNSDWLLDNDGYYYYQGILQKDEVSTPFLSAVEFNKYVSNNYIGINSNGEYDETLYTNGEYQGYFQDNTHIFSYISSGNGYDNAKYSLTINIQFTDANTNAMIDIFNYDEKSQKGGAKSLYDILKNV